MVQPFLLADLGAPLFDPVSWIPITQLAGVLPQGCDLELNGVRNVDPDIGLVVAMCLVVLLSKLLGATLAGVLGGMKRQEVLQLGVGMIPRGEVTLIVATVGISEGLIGGETFSVVVGIVIFTVLLTPLLLRRAFARAAAPDLPLRKAHE